MQKTLTNEEIVRKLQDHAIECKKIDDLVLAILDDVPSDYDPDRTAGDTLFGQAARSIQLLERMQTQLAFEEFYERGQKEKALTHNAKLLKSNEFLKQELSQLAQFNPDWDVLEATRASLRIHMVMVRKMWTMAQEMEDESNSLFDDNRYDAAAQLDHWSGAIKGTLEEEIDK
jgi:hypothetical protein